MSLRSHGYRMAGAFLALAWLVGALSAETSVVQSAADRSASAAPRPSTPDSQDKGRPDFARMVRDQAATDRAWRVASEGYMRMEKITYRSSRGDLDVPAFVFQPLSQDGGRRRPALVW